MSLCYKLQQRKGNKHKANSPWLDSLTNMNCEVLRVEHQTSLV